VGLSAAVVLVAVVLAGQLSAPADARITLDPGTRYQTIVGWESTAAAGIHEPAHFPKFRDALFDRVVEDLGITRLRLEVRSGVENTHDWFAETIAGTLDYQGWRPKRYATINDNDDPNVIDWGGFHFTEMDRNVEQIVFPIRDRLERRGETLQVSLCYVAFTGQIPDDGTYHHADPREYGEFMEAVWRHLRDKYGWVPDNLEIILEPDNVRQWNGELIGRSMVEVARRLTAAGFTLPRFIAPSTTSMSVAVEYFDDMMRVRGASDLLSELSYHRYAGVSASTLSTIRERARRRGIASSMLEHMGASYEALHDDLKIGWVSAWSQYVLANVAADSGGHYYWIDVADPDTPRISLGRLGVFLRQYFHYVRPGAVRIGAETTNRQMDPVAFENTDGSTVVVVKADRQGLVAVEGLAAGVYSVSFVTGDAPQVVLPDVVLEAGGRLSVPMPGPGVFTVSGKRRPADRPIGASPRP
jgi:hypothetical protein